MRLMKIAALAGLSSVYLLQNGCSLLPNVGSIVRAQINAILASLGIGITV
jgi:hypothetical protein